MKFYHRNGRLCQSRDDANADIEQDNRATHLTEPEQTIPYGAERNPAAASCEENRWVQEEHPQGAQPLSGLTHASPVESNVERDTKEIKALGGFLVGFIVCMFVVLMWHSVGPDFRATHIPRVTQQAPQGTPVRVRLYVRNFNREAKDDLPVYRLSIAERRY